MELNTNMRFPADLQSFLGGMIKLYEAAAPEAGIGK